MVTKWDIPLLNQPSREHLFIPSLWAKEIARAYDNETAWQKIRRVWELRKSVADRE